MAVAIDASAGGAASNSFVTLAEATTYMESRLNDSTWTAASIDNQNRALVEATREISVMRFKGERATEAQALSWPRQNAQNPDSPYGWLFESTVIPQRVKDATMELAFQFIKAGTSDLAVADAETGVQEKTIDVITTRWFSPGSKATGLSKLTRVVELLTPLLESSNRAQLNLVRG